MPEKASGGDDLDLDLDLDQAEEAAGEDELDLDLDFDDDDTAPAVAPSDDLDLDLDLDFDSEEPAAATADQGADDLDLDFDLDMDDEPATAGAPAAGDDELQLDLYGLEEMVKSQDGAKAAVEEPGEEELDLSELEDFLDDAGDATPAVAADDDLDLDLELDLSPDATAEPEPDMAVMDATDLDLTDVEDLLVEESVTEPAGSGAVGEAAAPPPLPDESIELPPDLDLDEVNLSMDDNGDMQLDFGMDDMDVSAMTDDDMDFAGTIEIPPPTEDDFNISGEDMVAGAAAAAAAGGAIAVGDEEPGEEEPKKKKKAAGKKKKKKTPVGRRKKSKAVPVLVVFLLLLLGAVGVYLAVTVMDVQIPYVSDFLNPQPADPMGNLKMATQGEAVSRFMENKTAGRLLIITGKVKNDYPEMRRNVRMVGRLFAKGKKLIQIQTAYAGNIVSDQDLMTGAFPALRKRLLNRARSRVAPGRTIPYMLVFNKLPQNLDEFTVEVAGSESAGAK